MRRALVVLALFGLMLFTVGALLQHGGGGRGADGVYPLPVYDADADGDADGNPANPAMGDIWRNGAPGCNWPMVQTPLGPRCIGTDNCPVECF